MKPFNYQLNGLNDISMKFNNKNYLIYVYILGFRFWFNRYGEIVYFKYSNGKYHNYKINSQKFWTGVSLLMLDEV